MYRLPGSLAAIDHLADIEPVAQQMREPAKEELAVGVPRAEIA
jgi:hypothetical protein